MGLRGSRWPTGHLWKGTYVSAIISGRSRFIPAEKPATVRPIAFAMGIGSIVLDQLVDFRKSNPGFIEGWRRRAQ